MIVNFLTECTSGPPRDPPLHHPADATHSPSREYQPHSNPYASFLLEAYYLYLTTYLYSFTFLPYCLDIILSAYFKLIVMGTHRVVLVPWVF